MRTLILLLFFLLQAHLHAQTSAGEEGRNHMYRALTDEYAAQTFSESDLQNQAWEALAYVEESNMSSVEDLQEAVGDYYKFSDNGLHLILLNKKDNEISQDEYRVFYKLDSNGIIKVMNKGGAGLIAEWQLIYLDRNYMAMDMGDIRVFFIHTPVRQ